jgi:hypothetical protein
MLKKVYSEESSSKETLLQSKHTTLMKLKPTKWPSTNSPPLLMLNLLPTIWDLTHLLKWSRRNTLKEAINHWLETLIGSQKEKLAVLKTKDHVDLAGPSVLPEFLNRFLCLMDNLSAYPNSNWSTVQDHKETKDATVDGLQVLWITLKLTDLVPKQHILT